MTQPPSDDRDPHEPESRMPVLIGLVVVILLVVAAYWLVQRLHEQGRIEDCLMAGRRNCAPVDTGR